MIESGRNEQGVVTNGVTLRTIVEGSGPLAILLRRAEGDAEEDDRGRGEDSHGHPLPVIRGNRSPERP